MSDFLNFIISILWDHNAGEILSTIPIAAAGGGGGMGGILGKMGGMGGGGGGGSMYTKAVNAGNKPLKASMGLMTGLLQGIQGMRLKKKAEAAFPELIDPNQAGYLAELNQKRRSIETGADFAEGMRSADTSQAGADQSLINASGGNVGGTISALLQSQASTNAAKNQIIAQGQGQQFNYNSAYGKMLDLIAQRKASLQLRRNQQLAAEASTKLAAASANSMAGLASLAPGGNATGKPAMDLQSSTAPSIDFSKLNQEATMNKALEGKPEMNPNVALPTTGVQAQKVVPQNILSNIGTPIQLK